jgi:hypothetical protein
MSIIVPGRATNAGGGAGPRCNRREVDPSKGATEVPHGKLARDPWVVAG